jgi:hypothetical protein
MVKMQNFHTSKAWYGTLQAALLFWKNHFENQPATQMCCKQVSNRKLVWCCRAQPIYISYIDLTDMQTNIKLIEDQYGKENLITIGHEINTQVIGIAHKLTVSKYSNIKLTIIE